MTPKQKAEELVNKMKYPLHGVYIISHVANELALIAVDEAIEFEKRIIKEVQFLSDKAGHAFRCDGLYWELVKQEIEKL